MAVLALLGPTLLPAQDSPSTVRVALVEAETRIEDILVRSGRQASYLVFAAACDLRIFIQSFRLAAGKALEGPPHALPPPQQQLLADIQQGVTRLEQAADQSTAEAHTTLKPLRSLSDEALTAARAGQVLAAGPAVLSPPSGEEVHFTVRGQDLEHQLPRLFVGGTEVRRLTVASKEAVFAIPANSLHFQEALPMVRAGRLVLGSQECTLWLFCKDGVREYPIRLLLLPQRLASVRVSYNRKVRQRVYEEAEAPHGAASTARTDKVHGRSFEFSSDDLTLMRCTAQTQAPHAEGYMIDTTSVYLTVRSSTDEARARLTGVSSNGFGVELCAQAQIHRLIKTNGEISVNVAWKEYRMADVVLPAEQLPVQELRWNTPIQASLPPDTSAIAVQVDYFDGSHVTYTGDTQDDYLELRWDSSRSQLQLTARDTAGIDGID